MKKLFICFLLVMGNMVLFPAFGSCQDFNPKDVGIEVLSNGKFIRFSNLDPDNYHVSNTEELLVPISDIYIARVKKEEGDDYPSVRINYPVSNTVLTLMNLEFPDDKMAQNAFEELVSMIEDID